MDSPSAPIPATPKHGDASAARAGGGDSAVGAHGPAADGLASAALSVHGYDQEPVTDGANDATPVQRATGSAVGETVSVSSEPKILAAPDAGKGDPWKKSPEGVRIGIHNLSNDPRPASGKKAFGGPAKSISKVSAVHLLCLHLFSLLSCLCSRDPDLSPYPVCGFVFWQYGSNKKQPFSSKPSIPFILKADFYSENPEKINKIIPAALSNDCGTAVGGTAVGGTDDTAVGGTAGTSATPFANSAAGAPAPGADVIANVALGVTAGPVASGADSVTPVEKATVGAGGDTVAVSSEPKAPPAPDAGKGDPWKKSPEGVRVGIHNLSNDPRPASGKKAFGGPAKSISKVSAVHLLCLHLFSLLSCLCSRDPDLSPYPVCGFVFWQYGSNKKQPFSSKPSIPFILKADFYSENPEKINKIIPAALSNDCGTAVGGTAVGGTDDTAVGGTAGTSATPFANSAAGAPAPGADVIANVALGVTAGPVASGADNVTPVEKATGGAGGDSVSVSSEPNAPAAAAASCAPGAAHGPAAGGDGGGASGASGSGGAAGAAGAAAGAAGAAGGGDNAAASGGVAGAAAASAAAGSGGGASAGSVAGGGASAGSVASDGDCNGNLSTITSKRKRDQSHHSPCTSDATSNVSADFSSSKSRLKRRKIARDDPLDKLSSDEFAIDWGDDSTEAFTEGSEESEMNKPVSSPISRSFVCVHFMSCDSLFNPRTQQKERFSLEGSFNSVPRENDPMDIPFEIPKENLMAAAAAAAGNTVSAASESLIHSPTANTDAQANPSRKRIRDTTLKSPSFLVLFDEGRTSHDKVVLPSAKSKDELSLEPPLKRQNLAACHSLTESTHENDEFSSNVEEASSCGTPLQKVLEELEMTETVSFCLLLSTLYHLSSLLYSIYNTISLIFPFLSRAKMFLGWLH